MGEMTTEEKVSEVPTGEGVSSKDYKVVLEKSEGTLVDCLKPSQNLLDHLQLRAVLSDDMIAKIVCRPNRPDKVRWLLTFLKKLGPDSLEALIEGLRLTDQEFLANILAGESST